MNIVVILNNIRSSENVGSIFRTSDAFGVKKIYLAGYTPAPLDRFNRKNTKLTKSSLGAEEFVEWEKVENLKDVIEKLKKEQFIIVGVEQDKNSIPYTKFHGPLCQVFAGSFPFILGETGSEASREKVYNTAFVFGNEVDGLSEEDLKLCDQIVEIPMRGKLKRELKEDFKHKESLNVAVAVGIILSNFNN